MSLVDSLDEVKLAAYLETRVADFKGPLQASKFPGGQSNPTFKIDAASGSYVLRRKPPGKLLKSAHAVDREFRVLQALAATDVPVARVYHLCEDPDIIGPMFYLMEFCEGNIHWEPELAKVSSNELRGHMYDEMNRVLAAIHCVDLEQHGLSDYGRPGNYFQRQFERWSSQYQASEITSIGEMDRLMAWLGDHLPADDGKVALVHGDFRVDNLMYSPDNRRIIAVLDWELSTLGHPYADLAYQCMALRLVPPGPYSAVGGLMGIDLGLMAALYTPRSLIRFINTVAKVFPLADWMPVFNIIYLSIACLVAGQAPGLSPGVFAATASPSHGRRGWVSSRNSVLSRLRLGW